MNQNAINTLQLRDRTFRTIRDYFYRNDFYEVDAPQLIKANAIEAFIEPIAAEVRSGEITAKRYLHTSPELFMKRLLAAGAERIFCLSHVFRDQEFGPKHLNEFQMLEWYRKDASVYDLIKDTELLIRELAEGISSKVALSGIEDSNDLKIKIETMNDLWNQFAEIDLQKILLMISKGDHRALHEAAMEKGHHLRPQATFADVFQHIMLKQIEPNIGYGSPCAVIRWPTQMASLSQVCTDDPLFADRVEIYAGGLELANGFLELNDPIEQRKRFAEEALQRDQNGSPDLPTPERFLAEITSLPNCAGIALGVDRTLMYLTGSKEIRSILPLEWEE